MYVLSIVNFVNFFAVLLVYSLLFVSLDPCIYSCVRDPLNAPLFISRKKESKGPKKGKWKDKRKEFPFPGKFNS